MVPCDLALEHKMGTLKAANDLLILGQFEEALDLSKNELKGLPDDKRDSRLAESLSVVAVQAFAELNRWQEVLPFVQDVFGGLEKIPPQVLQLCIALHAKMQDFAPITMVTEAWLAAPGNQEAGGLTRVAETYILLVLLPHSKFDDIRALVEGHPIIMEDKRKAFLQLVETEDRSVVEREDQTRCQGAASANKEQGASYGAWVAMMSWVKSSVSHTSPSRHVTTAVLLAVIGVVLALTLKKRKAATTGSRQDMLTTLGGKLAWLWQQLFAPYHLANS
ncbi:peroxisome assembly protein 26-like isoform X1 [Branchiostoma floridae]|uniref:Peroxisome assembly protein 26-like isoform X1 n=1 Tax=Branchiostoma floridae TaxID=7739 RepID=A0A9J7L445_BRAFL|nr:peroxisome assembly protein 26-like isoform X1 [Branchiostoma floridae]XP_035675954.1 peroxisome assembly protein 26-like isoform X1 [Branchiostoma floridae]